MSSEALSLVPWPQFVKRLGGGASLPFDTAIVAPSTLAGEAACLAETLRAATGFAVEIAPRSVSDFEIRLELSADGTIPAEGYRLAASSEGILVQATDAAGVFYGIQTLLQLFPPAVYGGGPRPGMAWTYPFVEIEDHPRFAWRGAMLDCTRHFFPKEFVRRFIDGLARHKLNSFHWHLTEDQGWRIEIKKYPRLTEVGAWRRESTFGLQSDEARGDGVPHGGFYTQDDIREIVAYARARHVRIVPEIEMPGHAQAAIAAYPELGCAGHETEVSTRWGIHETIYKPSERTFEFLQDVLTEVVQLFPGEYLHVGGDEAVKTQWINDPEVQQIKRALGLADEDALQSYFIGRINEFIVRHGRRLVGWDEILEGGLARGATVMSWRGCAGGIEAANHGHDVVMAPVEFTYLDHFQSADTAAEPLAFGGCLPVEKVYQFEPLLPEIRPECLPHVLGVQAQLWSEYLPTEQAVEYMAFPRLCALSEVAWSDRASRDWEHFLPRLRRHLKRLDVLRVAYRPLDVC